jgi:hypothetical protein
MKTFFGGIAFAIIGTLIFTFCFNALGYDLIGYSFETRILDSCILGGLVGALAGVPRLLNCRWVPSPPPVLILFSTRCCFSRLCGKYTKKAIYGKYKKWDGI